MNERLKEVRLYFNKTQEEFAASINIKSKAHISSLESGKRALTDRIINDVCNTYNVNEEWLRTGEGEMFIEEDTFVLDNYLKQKCARSSDIKIVKTMINAYLGVPEDLRDEFIDSFIKGFKNNYNDNDITATKSNDDYKQKELEAYAAELDAEEKGEISLVSEDSEERNLA